jgi:hypothetical protein
MKRFFAAGIFAVCHCVAVGQGTVNFSAGSSSATRISTNSVVGGPTTGQTAAISGKYYYALFVADSTVGSAGVRTAYGLLDPLRTPGWSQVVWQPGNTAGLSGPAYATNTAAAGRFTGNPTSNDVEVKDRPGGSTVNVIVVGWSANIAGADWPTAQAWIDHVLDTGAATSAGWAGASEVGTNIILGIIGVTAPGGLFGTGFGTIHNAMILQLQDVATTYPEPVITSVALTGTVATVTWTNAVASVSYATQFKDTVTNVNWSNVPGGPVTALGSIASQNDTNATAAVRYYRVRLLP